MPDSLPNLPSVLTWNVLHRVHAENWGEGAIAHHVNERDRTTAICERIATELANGADIVCLQEASGDLLSELRRSLSDLEIFDFCYPRVPTLRSGKPSSLSLPTEHLIILTRVSGRLLHRMAFASDAGKGFLSIALPTGATVVNTHVTWGDKAPEQLAVLADHARAQSGPVFIAGDFNADATIISTALGAEFRIADLAADALATRPRTSEESKSQNIDHVMSWRGPGLSAAVLAAGGLSDHNLVHAKAKGNAG